MIQKYFHEVNKVAENVAPIGSRENTLLAVMIACDSNDTQFITFLALASSAVTPSENLVHGTLIILGCVKYFLFSQLFDNIDHIRTTELTKCTG